MQETIQYNGHNIYITEVTVDHYASSRVINLRGELLEYVKLTPKLTKQQTINKVISNFDFEKVVKVMNFLNWTWVTSNTESGIPSIGELVVSAHELLSQAYDGVLKAEKTFFTATGGFKASATKYDDGEIVLELEFIISNFNYSNMDTCY